jgi:hypothetical protein
MIAGNELTEIGWLAPFFSNLLELLARIQLRGSPDGERELNASPERAR